MKKLNYLLICIFSLISAVSFCNERAFSAESIFDNQHSFTSKELYQMARTQMASGNLNAARLLALRVFFDGDRSPNLLNLLGVIEIQSERPLLAAEWFRKALCLSVSDKIAQRYLTRLPPRVKAIPVDPDKIANHFIEIDNTLPKILSKLSNPRLHFGAVLKAIERGQLYLSLALAEEYEKKYPGPDGPALSALSAWYLGRNKDALQIVEHNLKTGPYNPILLFVKAMINDFHPATSAPSHMRALYEMDQWNRALSIVDQYAKFFPSCADAHLVKARILLDIFNIEEAEEALREAGMREPGNPELDLLYIDYFLLKGMKQRAEARLDRAFRMGYNLPSVNLTAGLFAGQAGRLNELYVTLNDAQSCRPFTDPQAYPLYVSLLLMIENLEEAREVLDEWSHRTPMKSMMAYLEGYYYFKAGNNTKAIEYISKAFEMNPDRLTMIHFMAGLPVVQNDPTLFAKMSNRLAESHIQGFSYTEIPE